MLMNRKLTHNKKLACREVCGVGALKQLPERKGIKGPLTTKILEKGQGQKNKKKREEREITQQGTALF